MDKKLYNRSNPINLVERRMNFCDWKKTSKKVSSFSLVTIFCCVLELDIIGTFWYFSPILFLQVIFFCFSSNYINIFLKGLNYHSFPNTLNTWCMSYLIHATKENKSFSWVLWMGLEVDFVITKNFQETITIETMLSLDTNYKNYHAMFLEWALSYLKETLF